MEGLVVNKTPLKPIDNGRCYAKLTSKLSCLHSSSCHCWGRRRRMSLPWWISPTAVAFPSQTQLIFHPYQHHSHIRLRKLSSSPSTSTAPRAVLLDEIVQLTHNKVFQSLAFILLNISLNFPQFVFSQGFSCRRCVRCNWAARQAFHVCCFLWQRV